MRLYQTSYDDKNINRQIEEAVGKAYSFYDIVKLRGIGSRRLEVIEASVEFNVARNPGHYRTLVNIELRPKGLIVYFRRKLDNYTIVIPYQGLTIEYERDAVLYHSDSYLRIKDGYKKDKSFFKKVMQKI